MDQYLVELYLPRGDEAALADAAMRARAASEQVTSEGRHVRYLRTIFVPQGEICFHLYEAQAADVVGEASAGLRSRTNGSCVLSASTAARCSFKETSLDWRPKPGLRRGLRKLRASGRGLDSRESSARRALARCSPPHEVNCGQSSRLMSWLYGRRCFVK